ncbi:ParB-like nuclease domain containing protein [Methanonatronarchaeum thermophilum]|uniref:ParB-like nuclease domain containing protein n=1 Tax=Methanonatronarchaeum thermophilum TaxID=1927129 RepID=A0A1Y3GIN5_9EURY|nr:hypothetical protein [Methanonatronarchaeum thermophilum]OUJ19295.1 ParB-like nuclease domain containing protein [Methanonatronarchaeum thermophilum]
MNIRETIKKAAWIYRKKGFNRFLKDSKLFISYQLTKFPRSIKYKLKYGKVAPSQKREVIQVNPNEINYILKNPFQHEIYAKGSYVIGGDWDKKIFKKNNVDYSYLKKGERGLVPFENYILFQSIKNHYLNDVAWSNTKFYENKLSSNRKKEIIKNRIDGIEKLYKSIKENGYKSIEEIHKNLEKYAPPVRYDKNKDDKIARKDPKYREVTIAIGRDGKLIFLTGRHRICISKILEIDSIPVKVLVRHKRWQEKRYRVLKEREKFSSEELQHPDLKKLSSE